MSNEYTNEELDTLGKEFLRWLKDNENNDDVVHLSQFYCEFKDISHSSWDLIRKRSSFHHYYETARLWMVRKILLNRKIRTSYGMRYLAFYDEDLREHERAEKAYAIDCYLEKKAKMGAVNRIPQNDEQFSMVLHLTKENAALKEEIKRLKEKEERGKRWDHEEMGLTFAKPA